MKEPAVKRWARGKETALVVEHADGRRETSFHPSKEAARQAAADFLDKNGGKGKLVMAPKGKEHMFQPVPAVGGNRPAGPHPGSGGGGDDQPRDESGRFAPK